MSPPTPTTKGVPFHMIAVRLLLGQGLALLMSCTGLASTLLANSGASFPLLQAMSSYMAIVAVFVPVYLYMSFMSSRRREQKASRGHEHHTQSTSNGSLTNDSTDPGVGLVPFWELAKQRQSLASSDSSSSSFMWCCVKQLWPYAAIALIDVEANYLVVLAYRYTDMTSVQLLDCFTVPCVMVLSLIALKTKVTLAQGIGALVAVGGLMCLVIFDVDGLSRTSERPNAFLGDMLCLLSSLCYAISNVACETLLKRGPELLHGNTQPSLPTGTNAVPTGKPDETTPLSSGSHYGHALPREGDVTPRHYAAVDVSKPPTDRDTSLSAQEAGQPSTDAIVATDDHDEMVRNVSFVTEAPAPPVAMTATLRSHYADIVTYLALMSSFGLCIASLQFWATGEAAQFSEYRSAADHKWSDRQTLQLIFFALCMLTVYGLMPVLFMITSATFANLSLLTADIYAIIWNVSVFGVDPKPLFFVPFVVILGGVAFYDTDGGPCMKKKNETSGGDDSAEHNAERE